MVGRNSIVGTEFSFGRGLICMYKKANRFMIGSRKGSGYSGRGASSEPKRAATKLRKKTLAIAREYQKIMVKKKANELRILKERQRAIAEQKARATLREAIAASKDHKRLRLEVESKKAQIRKLEQLASKERNASGIVVVRRRDGRETKLRTGLVGQKAKPAPRPHK
jgi:hypothetical protein